MEIRSGHILYPSAISVNPFKQPVLPPAATAVTASFTALGGADNITGTKTDATHWKVQWDWFANGADKDLSSYEIPVTMTVGGVPQSIGSFVVVNINLKDLGIGLAGDTTDWKTGITDFTNVTGLTFEKGAAGSLGKLVIDEAVNLCDQTTCNALANLGDNLTIAAETMSLNTAADALAAFNKKATLTMYNAPFTGKPGIIYTHDGVKEVVVSSGTGTILSTSLIQSGTYSWDSDAKTLTFSVNSWSSYTAFGTGGEVSSVGGTGYLPNKPALLAPWIALGIILVGGITWLVLRRRRVYD